MSMIRVPLLLATLALGGCIAETEPSGDPLSDTIPATGAAPTADTVFDTIPITGAVSDLPEGALPSASAGGVRR